MSMEFVIRDKMCHHSYERLTICQPCSEQPAQPPSPGFGAFCGAAVLGALEGTAVVGSSVVGVKVGHSDSSKTNGTGFLVGFLEGLGVGSRVGRVVGHSVGLEVVGWGVGRGVGFLVGFFVLPPPTERHSVSSSHGNLHCDVKGYKHREE